MNGDEIDFEGACLVRKKCLN